MRARRGRLFFGMVFASLVLPAWAAEDDELIENLEFVQKLELLENQDVLENLDRAAQSASAPTGGATVLPVGSPSHLPSKAEEKS